MKIVFLDRKSIGEDLDYTPFAKLGEVVSYDYTAPAEVPERIRDADVLILNKVPVNESTVGTAEKLKLVCVTATGVNNLDIPYLEGRGIAWRNVAGYSTECVAQHTFAMLLYLQEHLPYYDRYVKSGSYASDTQFTHFAKTFHELCGRRWGIIGLGSIGRRVGEIAEAFGMKVWYYSTTGNHQDDHFRRVDLDTLLRESDVISVHAPLNAQTEGLMNREAFRKMKKTALFLNLGRGPIVCEADLCEALQEGEIRAAGLDVLCKEPMDPANPLLAIQDSGRLLITPHIAWAGVEARQRLMKIVAGQIEAFFGINHETDKEQ